METLENSPTHSNNKLDCHLKAIEGENEDITQFSFKME